MLNDKYYIDSTAERETTVTTVIVCNARVPRFQCVYAGTQSH